MRTSVGADGGFTVPADIITQVRELRRSGANLEDYVNVEPVRKSEGKRVYEVAAENEPFGTVGEGEVIPEVDEEQLVDVKYEIKKRAGIISVTNELLSDTNNAVLTWLKKWLAKKSRATRNKIILDKVAEMAEGHEVEITTAEELRILFNKTLDAAYTENAIVVTNADGYDYLDNLYDEKNEKALKVENRKPLLFGLYPVVKLSNSVLPNDATLNGCPIICGDLEAAVTLYDRENITIDLSSNGSTFFTDVTKIKARDRFDVQAVDKNAIIKAYATITE